MADNDKGVGMLIGIIIAAIILVPVMIYDHVRTKNKYYSKGKEDGYVEATVACEIKYRKLAEKLLAMKGDFEKRDKLKNALIEKLLKERKGAEDLKKEASEDGKKSARYKCLSGAIKNFGITIQRLRAA